MPPHTWATPAVSSGFGLTWTESDAFGPASRPSLAGGSGNAGLLFTGPGNSDDPQMVLSRDNGDIWGPTIVIDDGQLSDADFAKVSASVLTEASPIQ